MKYAKYDKNENGKKLTKPYEQFGVVGEGGRGDGEGLGYHGTSAWVHSKHTHFIQIVHILWCALEFTLALKVLKSWMKHIYLHSSHFRVLVKMPVRCYG
jgi:hypothetical protein